MAELPCQRPSGRRLLTPSEIRAKSTFFRKICHGDRASATGEVTGEFRAESLKFSPGQRAKKGDIFLNDQNICSGIIESRRYRFMKFFQKMEQYLINRCQRPSGRRLLTPAATRSKSMYFHQNCHGDQASATGQVMGDFRTKSRKNSPGQRAKILPKRFS